MKALPILLSLTLSLACPIAISAAEADVLKLPPPLNKKDVTYAKDVKTLFEKACFKCHGPEKQKGKLRLDSLEAARKGSENGKVVVPGDSAKSPLVIAVARLKEDEAMPPKDKAPPLTKEQVGLIRAWIDQGAK
jgi:hypothetical protein